MLNFDYIVPTKIFFGKGKIEELAGQIKEYAGRILLVYGEGSIKKNGLYDIVINILKNNGITYRELSGVMPNPRIESVRRGINSCRENNLEFVLAVGGGSVIDCAKAICAGFYHEGDPWDFYLRKLNVERALPLASILTLAASGSEMNGNSVISNEATKQKLVVANNKLRPKFSILDPTYTFTVSRRQTQAGIVDIFSHILEQYFSPTKDTFLQDMLAESMLKTCVEYGPIALKEPKNYEARAALLWLSSLALNGLLSYGKIGDWAAHCIEHEVSAMYDITHGAGLAILTPYWMEHVLNELTLPKFLDYSKNIWGIDGQGKLEAAKIAIQKTRNFFKALGLPAQLREVGVEEPKLEEMAEKAVMFGDLGSFKKLKQADVLKILRAAF